MSKKSREKLVDRVEAGEYDLSKMIKGDKTHGFVGSQVLLDGKWVTFDDYVARVYGTKKVPATTGAPWKTVTKEVRCSEIEGKPTIYFSKEVGIMVDTLMATYKHKEWLGRLTAHQLENGDWLCTHLSIPKQVVTGSTAEVEDGLPLEENEVGFIHSHHTMGAFHSSTDNEHIVTTYTFSIVVGHTKTDAKCKVTTPCGKFVVVEADVAYMPDQPDWVDEWLARVKANIEEKASVSKVYTKETYSGNYYLGAAQPPTQLAHVHVASGEKVAGACGWGKEETVTHP